MFYFYQVMAIGTLAMCYNNIEVFRDVVKMRRGMISINGHDFSILLIGSGCGSVCGERES